MAPRNHDSKPDIQVDIAPSGDIGTLPLLTTKLYRPLATPDLEPRTLLINRLERNRMRPLTLISAPAGYGKSMLASMWLETSGCTSGWVSLDENDNDLHTFVSYLLAALHKAFPTLQFKTKLVLEAPQAQPVPVFARYLLNDLDKIQEPFILVLDDIHLIREQAVFDLLKELLLHPPRFVHLVLIGRSDPPLPINSWRARGQVTEIRTKDLRLTPQQAAWLLNKLLNHQIDNEIAAEWTRMTEGWVTALRLAALSLRVRTLEDDLQVKTQGDIRYLKEYLLAEVLSRLPVVYQAWLLKTALFDRFCPLLIENVCQSETDPTDLSGESFVEWLEHNNLFLIALDDQGEWFRFHHLFQGFLQDMLKTQLSPTDIAALYSRASEWCSKHHLLEEALQYALAAGEVENAVHLVESHRYELMDTEQWHRLERWLNFLPTNVVAQSPQLICAKAYIAVYRGQDHELMSSLQHAAQLLANLAPGTEEHVIVQNELAVIYAALDNMAGQPARSLSRAESSLKLLPRRALHIRSIAIAVKAVSLQMLGDLNRGVTAIRDTLTEDSWSSGLQATLMHYLCIAFFQQGDLGSVLNSARTGLWITEKLQAPQTLSFCRYHLGIAHYLRNEFTQADPHLQALLQERAISAPSYLIHGSFSLALIYFAQGRTAEALNTIDLVEDHCRETNHLQALDFITAFRVELAIRQGKLLEALQLNQNVVYELRPPIWFFYVPQLTPIKLLLADGNDVSLKEARTRLDVLDRDMHRINRRNVRLDVLALSALVCAAQGDEPAAIEKLHTALELGFRGGNIRSFADLGVPMANLLRHMKEKETESEVAGYIDQILAAVPESVQADKIYQNVLTGTGKKSTETLLIEPLTRRERQVLKQLPKDITLQEIANQLSISPATVYTHTKNIYSKLDVHKREEAVQRAKDLGLV
jgi:LuxR family maltose regulon positive regulatory protein